ncbi:MAG: stage V sporulation protein AA [Eubacterium sp.]
MNETLYINIPQSVEVTDTNVTIGSIAKIECHNKCVLNKVKSLKLITIKDPQNKYRYIVSIMKIIELINKEYPGIQICNIGETDCVVEYNKAQKDAGALQVIKVAIVSFIIFFGSAFAIMSFNNDVSVKDMFAQIYEQIMGYEQDGFSIIELTYSLGLAAGIIVFYNHFGAKKLTKDPTPIEVEMRLYENEINTTLIDGHNRQDGNLEVK